jgi:2'-deoxynucleoside 5'-phosphate N-hydrolase
MKKVYFGCSIAGGRDHAHVYQDIVDIIKASGCHVLSEMFADKAMLSHVGPTPHLTTAEIWERDVASVKEADAIIAEVTQPSLGVGYEIGRAEEWDKPILALFYTGSGRRLSPMVSGNPRVTVCEYNDVQETKKTIADFIKNLK